MLGSIIQPGRAAPSSGTEDLLQRSAHMINCAAKVAFFNLTFYGGLKFYARVYISQHNGAILSRVEQPQSEKYVNVNQFLALIFKPLSGILSPTFKN